MISVTKLYSLNPTKCSSYRSSDFCPFINILFTIMLNPTCRNVVWKCLVYVRGKKLPLEHLDDVGLMFQEHKNNKHDMGMSLWRWARRWPAKAKPCYVTDGGCEGESAVKLCRGLDYFHSTSLSRDVIKKSLIWTWIDCFLFRMFEIES